MKFDQLALIASSNNARKAAMEGAEFAVQDVVTARGVDAFGRRIVNKALLAFNYTLWPCEYEVLQYIEGWNWHDNFMPPRNTLTTSHFGVHVNTLDEVAVYRRNFGRPLQEVVTIEHENSACADRRYHYIIFDTRPRFGCALKVIRRLTLEEAADLLL